MSLQRHPTIVSCVLALNVEPHKDGTITLHRCFEHLSIPRSPFVHKGFAAFLEFTDGRGKSEIVFRLVDANEDLDPVTTFTLKMDFLDPTGRAIGAFTFRDIRFERAGPYRLQAWCGSELVLNKRLEVVVAY
ncbi:MAG: DUF6941 family protein [Phycisphaerales bacterium]